MNYPQKKLKTKPSKGFGKQKSSGFTQQNLITSLKKIAKNDNFSPKSLKNSKTFKPSQRIARMDNSSVKKGKTGLRGRKSKRFEEYHQK